MDKEYLALVQGVPVPGMEQGRVDLPLLPAPGGRGERVMVAEDRGAIYSHRALPAETRFRVERRGAAQALLRVFIHAGRRHQIRAHLSYLGLPIYGDTLYGGPSLPEELAVRLPADRYAEAQGPFLHAGLLRFPSPRDGRLIAVTAPLPAGRQLLLDLLFGAAS